MHVRNVITFPLYIVECFIPLVCFMKMNWSLFTTLDRINNACVWEFIMKVYTRNSFICMLDRPVHLLELGKTSSTFNINISMNGLCHFDIDENQNSCNSMHFHVYINIIEFLVFTTLVFLIAYAMKTKTLRHSFNKHSNMKS